jgi:hypothetical protein
VFSSRNKPTSFHPSLMFSQEGKTLNGYVMKGKT